ncbi:hypothetical protein KCP75_15390 [Salmonella enterica subsp. enterica]|nr:hypothetical protein KCP75_15390 [Salmonella enterica subsp. enterica]
MRKFAGRRFVPAGAEEPITRGGNAIFTRGLSRWRGNTKIFGGSASRQVAVYPHAGAGNTGRLCALNRLLPVLSPAGQGHPNSGQCPCARGRFIPLARGTRCDDAAGSMLTQFIPAGAGTRSVKPVAPASRFMRREHSSSKAMCVRAPVYPRWRGNTVNGHIVMPTSRRFIPLAQGTPVVMRF